MNDPVPYNPSVVRENIDWKALGLTLVLAVLLCAVLAFVTLLKDGVAGHYVVVAPPWTDAIETAAVVSAAQGDMVAMGGFDNVMIAASDDPEFASAAKAAGAWAVFAAPSVLGCGEMTRDWGLM